MKIDLPIATGFTLVELLAAIGIVSVALILGVPNFRGAIQNSRVASQSNEIGSALNLAKSEAVKRGVRVTVCKIKGADLSRCDTTGNWTDGWIIFVDAGNAFAAAPANFTPAADAILSVHASLAPSTLGGYGNFASYVSFVGAGVMQLASGVPPDGAGADHFRLCPQQTGGPAVKGRSLTTNAVGRLTIAEVDCP